METSNANKMSLVSAAEIQQKTGTMFRQRTMCKQLARLRSMWIAAYFRADFSQQKRQTWNFDSCRFADAAFKESLHHAANCKFFKWNSAWVSIWEDKWEAFWNSRTFNLSHLVSGGFKVAAMRDNPCLKFICHFYLNQWHDPGKPSCPTVQSSILWMLRKI